MSSISRKHGNFVSEPMGSKKATEIAGIGPVLGEKLKQNGYEKANQVLGQYLIHNKDTKQFGDWLKGVANASDKAISDTSKCLNEYCDQFM